MSACATSFLTIVNTGGVSYELTPNAQIWPRSQNSTIGGDDGSIYLVVADMGTPSGQGLDFISMYFFHAAIEVSVLTTLLYLDGFCFLQRFYSVFDTTNVQVGLATTPFTDATTN